MERLTTLLALTLLSSLCNLADGQTVTFTVAGDVAKPRTLALHGASAGQTVFLNDLLQDAGIQGEGSAVILRGEPPQTAGSEWVSAEIAERGSKLENGDIVIFHRVLGPASLGRHIVVVAGSTRGVAQLADTGNHLKNLLTLLGVDSAVGFKVPIIRTSKGSAVRHTVEPDDLLIHGDVVLLNGSGMLSTVAQARITQLCAQISETELAPPSNAKVQTVSDEQNANTPLSVRESGWLTLPAVQSKHGEPAANASEIPVVRSSVETIVPPDTGGTTPANVGVVPDGDLPANDHDPAAAGVSPLWNGVFIFGLFGSIALILTGWLKTQREQAALKRQASESETGLQTPRETPAPTESIASSLKADNRSQPAMLTSELTTPPESRQAISGQRNEAVSTAETSTVVPEASQTHNATFDPARLVEEQEWFGANWRGSGADGSVLDLCETPQELNPTPGVTSDSHLAAASAASHSSETNAAKRLTAADDLEDLLQNRLPVELQQADLPCRVTLFGRPAGPRRLRIDAAHSQIAAPNFSADSRSGRVSSQRVTPDTDEQSSQDTASLDRALNSLHEQGH